MIRLKSPLSLGDYRAAKRKDACLHPNLPLASPFTRDNLVTFTKSDTPKVGQPGANLGRPIRSGTLLYRFQRWQERELVETSRLKLAAVPYLRHQLVD